MSTAASNRADNPDRGVSAGPFDNVAYLFAMIGQCVLVGGLFF